MMKVILCLLALLFAACATGYKNITSLTPLKRIDGYQYFTYTSYADAEYPVYSREAEQARMQWLEEWLADFGYQPDKYEIISRKQKFTGRGPLGSSYDVYYEVKVPLEE